MMNGKKMFSMMRLKISEEIEHLWLAEPSLRSRVEFSRSYMVETLHATSLRSTI